MGFGERNARRDVGIDRKETGSHGRLGPAFCFPTANGSFMGRLDVVLF